MITHFQFRSHLIIYTLHGPWRSFGILQLVLNNSLVEHNKRLHQIHNDSSFMYLTFCYLILNMNSSAYLGQMHKLLKHVDNQVRMHNAGKKPLPREKAGKTKKLQNVSQQKVGVFQI